MVVDLFTRGPLSSALPYPRTHIKLTFVDYHRFIFPSSSLDVGNNFFSPNAIEMWFHRGFPRLLFNFPQFAIRFCIIDISAIYLSILLLVNVRVSFLHILDEISLGLWCGNIWNGPLCYSYCCYLLFMNHLNAINYILEIRKDWHKRKIIVTSI